MATKEMTKGKDVGAAKGDASPGPDNSSADMNADMKAQKKGPKGEPTVTQLSASDAGSYADRGLTSPVAMKHWKASGYKAPKDEAEDHISPRKVK